MAHHTLTCRVYYENTDAGGIVYHGQYLNFAERGRTEFLRDVGHESGHLTRERGIMFVARYLDINYFAPAYLDNLIDIQTSIAELKNSSFTMRQTFFRHNEGIKEKMAELKVTLVCVKSKDIRPVRVPDDIRNAFKDYLESE